MSPEHRIRTALARVDALTRGRRSLSTVAADSIAGYRATIR